jgi:multidrug efflux pump subunit AcrB
VFKTSLKRLVDDGDGMHVLPITIKLSPVTATQSLKSTASNAHTDPGPSKRDTFPSKEERLARKRAKAAEEIAREEARREGSTMAMARDGLRTKIKTYVRKDIRVGDTVRVVGRIDEYARKKASGELESVRTLWVEEGSGGSIGE